MINFKKYLAMNEVNNINNIDINSLIDKVISCTYNRITLSASDYQELVAKAANQDHELNKKMTALMEKDLETIRRLEKEIAYWKSLYNEAMDENRKQTKSLVGLINNKIRVSLASSDFYFFII